MEKDKERNLEKFFSFEILLGVKYRYTEEC